MYKFYFTKRSLNDATEYYVSLIERAIAEIGERSVRVYNVKDLNKGDVVVTIEAKDFFIVSMRRPGLKMINWYQGIVPEEAFMMFGSLWRKKLWEIFESFTLRKAALNIFVSQSMQRHYLKKYQYNDNNYFVMPCYNQQLNQLAFEHRQKYSVPSFVYAGSLAKWQCVDQALITFKGVQDKIPKARITLLTNEKEQAETLFGKYDIRNGIVKYCPLNELQKELEQYKYGFLIREDHVVNNVATPTKMNSYLSAGIIPVYTNVIDSFEEHLRLEGYAVKFDYGNIEDAVNQILKLENRHINTADILNQYKKVFELYYNDDEYVESLKSILKS